jgi:hypothetical protein
VCAASPGQRETTRWTGSCASYGSDAEHLDYDLAAGTTSLSSVAGVSAAPANLAITRLSPTTSGWRAHVLLRDARGRPASGLPVRLSLLRTHLDGTGPVEIFQTTVRTTRDGRAAADVSRVIGVPDWAPGPMPMFEGASWLTGWTILAVFDGTDDRQPAFDAKVAP